MPILTLFAGPNGSGKSTIVEQIQANERYSFAANAHYLNADELEKQLRLDPFLNLRAFWLYNLSQVDWERFVRTASLTRKLCAEKQIDVDYLLTCIKLIHGTLVIRTEKQGNEPEYLAVDSYVAALIIEFVRQALIRTQQSFAFETVMSHPGKLEMMRQAREAGFTVHLYYITTRDPDINVARVGHRAASGGHPVAEAKIRSRYYQSLANLAEALRCAHEAWLFDNSTNGVPGIEVAHKKGTDLWLMTDDVPGWYIRYVEQPFLT